MPWRLVNSHSFAHFCVYFIVSHNQNNRGDYCSQVSPTNCTVPDGVASRPPLETEQNRYFAGHDTYTGYFRKTDENDCEKYPHNCTGHVADYPCGWSSYVESQAYHLNIAMQSSGNEPGSRGYTYGQLTEIYEAANATKSDLLIYWWTPEALYNKYFGTDAEMQNVAFPAPTQECFRARLEPVDRCSLDINDRIGDPRGVCDESPNPLTKLVSKALYRENYIGVPPAIRSPAYEFVQAFQVSELQVGEMFNLWQKRRTPREAVCEWAVKNFDYLETFVPRTYPRVFREHALDEGGLLTVSLILGSLASVLVLITGWMVHKKRYMKSIRLAVSNTFFVRGPALLPCFHVEPPSHSRALLYSKLSFFFSC